MTEPEPSIDFIFTVSKVESMADGSPRITLDLTEQDIPKAAMLWECKQKNLVLQAHITEFDNSFTNMDKTGHEIDKGTTRQSKRVGRSRL